MVSEYFFERPKTLKQKHPALYKSLQTLYQQDTAAIGLDVITARNAQCPCGSGKKFKRCCMPKD
ncbi:zinc-dependent peptidase [Halioxenophilus aromaticivorans]|uniref:zinc-dependent peptidase n=1 Tax=Halioxenophilus aromaticivorans TaxID=1306992 RepID=UPI0036F1E57F